MADIRGEARKQATMFPVTGDELIPADHSRVIEAFVDRLDMAGRSGRSRAAGLRSAGSTDAVWVRLSAAGAVVAKVGRRGQGNVAGMGWLGRWQPEHKSIAEFRRAHSQAVRDGGGERVRCARSVGGVTVAVESGREGDAGKRYLEPLDRTDAQDEGLMDARAVQAALERRKAKERSGRALHADRHGVWAGLQRADRGGYRTRADRSPAGPR